MAPPRSDAKPSTTPWAALVGSMRAELKGAAAAQANRRRGAAEFADWADKRGLTFPCLTADHDHAVSEFKDTLDVHMRTDGTLSKQGEACVAAARELLQRSLPPPKVEVAWETAVANIAKQMKPAEVEQEPLATMKPSFVTADQLTTPPEDQMANHNEEQEEEVLEEQEQEEQEEEETDEVEEVEERPRRRRAGPVIRERVVERRPARPAIRAAQGRSAAVKHIMPRPEKIRLYKRNEMGKRELIDDFTVDEIGDLKLEAFIREYIHPEFGNDGVDTEYIAYELDSRSGNEKQPPSSIALRAVQGEAPAADPFGNVRSAMHMLHEMQGMMQQQQPQPPPNSMLEAAKQNLLKGGGQMDMGQMMMLMMMERLMGSPQQSGVQQGEILLKILDRLDKVERGPQRQPGPEFGAPPSFGGFPMPPFPGFMQPAPVATPERASDKLLDLAMAKLAQPPPSLADSVKELMALQTLMQPKQGDSAELAALRAELRSLAGAGKPPPDSLEAGMATFEKMLTMQKAVATQVGGGSDVGGFLKGLITPEVGKAIAQVVQSAQQKPGAAPVAPAAQPAAPQAPPQRDYNYPPHPLPQSVSDAGKAFMLAQTREVQAARFVDFVLAMYMTQDPYYVKLLTPALESLNKAEESVENLKPARALATQLIHEMRPPLASPDFVDACLAAMAVKAGVERLPETLVSTHGKWTFNGRDVVMKSDVAAPVPVPQQGAQVIKFPPVEPSVSKEQREKELGYVREPEKSEAPLAAPVKSDLPIESVAAPVLSPSTQVIEAAPQRELVPAQPAPSA